MGSTKSPLLVLVQAAEKNRGAHFYQHPLSLIPNRRESHNRVVVPLERQIIA